MGCGLDVFLQGCRPLDDGLAGIGEDQAWRLGVVLLVRSGDEFAAVQKASRDSYDFSGKWALPGGMVRALDPSMSSQPMVEASLVARVDAETGLIPDDLAPCHALGPIVTSYMARGAQRLTLVTAFVGHLPEVQALQSRDASIQQAAWIPPSVELGRFAPANRVILGHLLWRQTGAEQRETARRAVAEAVEECGSWAMEADVAPPAAPWASAKEISDWALAWPS